MRIRFVRAAVFTVLFLAALVLVVFGLIYARLTQGPVALGFLQSRIEAAVSAELPDMAVTLGDAVLMIDSKSGIPQIRFNNIVLADKQGNVLATAPQAAVSLDKTSLFLGKLSARSFELIGPKISAQRNVDGSIVLGVSSDAGGAAADATVQSAEGKTDQAGGTSASVVETSGSKLIGLLDRHDQNNALSALDDIRISNATLNFYDDSNAATWFSPKADLTFKKTDNGFVILAKADVATSDKPWHAEISATYRHESRKFEVSSTIDNLVPASVAEKIFSLSQLAALTTPLSGHIDFVAGADGLIASANGEFQATAGKITLPDYFAEPIAIDEGSLRMAYDAATGGFNINNSSLIIGGGRVDLSGSVLPVRAVDGKLTALDIKLATRNAVDTSEKTSNTLVDRIEFSGRAAVDRARLDIDDLVVMSANTGLRLRGNITGAQKSPGIHIAGRVRDISADLLKTIWPPIVASKARAWVNENIVDGRVAEGTFQVNFAENQLAEAKQAHKFPDGVIDFSVSLKDVTSRYFKTLPVLQGASGKAEQHDNKFLLSLDGGQSRLDGGEAVNVKSGSFEIDELLTEGAPGVFSFDLESSIKDMLAFASHPDVKMIKEEAKPDFPLVKGTSHVKLDLKFPLIKDVPKERVQLTTSVQIKNVEIPNIAPDMDLTEGNFTISVGAEKIDISGPAKINNLPATIEWSKPRQGGSPTAKLTTTLDEKAREKIGVKVSDYLSGPVPIEATFSKDQNGNSVFQVEADLSQASMKLATLSWKRPPTDGTVASFRLKSTETGRSIEDFKLDGSGLHLRGAMELTPLGRLKAVSMSEIKLDEDNVFSARIIPGDGTVDLQVSGTNLDARPYIKTILSPPKKDEGAAGSGQDFTMRARFDKVLANRGEIITGVTANLRARAGRIAEATIQGTYPNGQPVTATVVPTPQGREMRLKSADAGSTMRAANFYGKIAGGLLDFYALIGNEEGSPLRNGNLTIRNFDVRNEATLAKLDERGTPRKSGPRAEGVSFSLLSFPFSADDKMIRFKGVTARGPDMCATADGVIRKSDNALSASGTVVPACGLSRALNNVPLVGDILSGGNYNEGIFGVTYAMTGTLSNPSIQVNPLSMIAPGIFRRLFDFNPKAPVQEPDGTKQK